DRGRDPDATRTKLEAQIPLGRLGDATEVADMIVYLASDEARFVTGAEFVIDGGLTAG
ncbi:MAG: SDR family oxidoreductase, partial [Proteobacteria bacterium]|nr:SDR family oxidoreductase [Pseudomonadota bacterium]